MPSTEDPPPQVTPSEFAYFQMGRATGALNARGLTLPTRTLVDPDSFVLRPDGQTVLGPLAPLHELQVLHPPSARLTEQEVLDVLRPVTAAIRPDLWKYFGAGYLESAEEAGCGLVAAFAMRTLTLRAAGCQRKGAFA
jgi:hypothetical protein